MLGLLLSFHHSFWHITSYLALGWHVWKYRIGTGTQWGEREAQESGRAGGTLIAKDICVDLASTFFFFF